MFFHKAKTKRLFSQLLLITIIVYLAVVLFNNTMTHLEKQQITSGFSFLKETSGFSIIFHLIEYSENSTYGRVFIVGILNTLLVSVLSIIVATILGFILGIARLSSNWLIAKLSLTYIEIFRNIPLLLQIFFWYFCVLRLLPHPKHSFMVSKHLLLNNRGLYFSTPQLNEMSVLLLLTLISIIALYLLFFFYKPKKLIISSWINILFLLILPAIITSVVLFKAQWDIPSFKGFNFTGGSLIIPELFALLFALSSYTAAFIAEIVRAGLLSVDIGQTEAAKSLGLSKLLTLKLITLPQALKVIIPPLINQYLNLTKNSSLAAAIAFPDLVSVFAGTSLNQTGQAIEIIGMTMAVYLSISLCISLFINHFHKKRVHWS